MKIAIASGKGGTGKTTLSTNLASFIAESRVCVLSDLDVEEPNSGLFIKAELIHEEDKFKMIPAGTIIHFHSHDTAGIAVAAYIAAIEAGADQIDLSLAPASGGTCQPDVLTMWHVLRDTDYDLGIDPDKILKVEKVFKECMKDYFLPPEATMVEPLIPWSPMPGGALTANTQMLRDNNLMDRYQEIMSGMGEVVRKGGYGTSVTPVSQFYFQQAFNNTMLGEWEKIADGYGKMVLGYFGKTPVEPEPEIIKLASKQLGLEPTTKKVLEINDADDSKGIAPAKKALKDAGLKITDENVFIAATCKEKGITFLKGDAKLGIRLKEKTALSGAAAAGDSGHYTVTVDGKKYKVSIDGENTIVNGKTYSTAIEDSEAHDHSVKSGEGAELKSPMHGKVFKIVAKPGDHVSEGDIIIVLEAMKMEMDIISKTDGIVNDIMVELGDQVADGDVVAHIG